MDWKNNLFHINEALIITIIVCIFIIFSKSNTKSCLNEMDVQMTQDSLYYAECEQINSYKYGIDLLGKKRMILSTAAKHYFEEVVRGVDSTVSAVEVIYQKEHKGYEVYWISQGFPMSFGFANTITNIDCHSKYIVLYSIKNQPSITYDDIRTMGFNDNTDFFVVQEVSWFLFIDPKTTRHLLVKDAYNEDECTELFEEFLQDKDSSCRVAHIMVYK